MSLGHVTEIFIGSWICRFGEKIELKLINLGIMSLTEAIKVHKIVNFGLLVEKADSLLYKLYLNNFEHFMAFRGRVLFLMFKAFSINMIFF